MTSERTFELRALCAEYKKKLAACEAAGLKDKAADIAADGVGRRALESMPELIARIRKLERKRYWLAGQLAHVCRSYLNCGLDCPNPIGECVETTAKQWSD